MCMRGPGTEALCKYAADPVCPRRAAQREGEAPRHHITGLGWGSGDDAGAGHSLCLANVSFILLLLLLFLLIILAGFCRRLYRAKWVTSTDRGLSAAWRPSKASCQEGRPVSEAPHSWIPAVWHSRNAPW